MGKSVLITGASAGIGKLTAELMARRGWRVAATARHPEPLRAWAQERGIMETLRLDVTDEASIAAAVAAAAERFGGLDVLVNNAGYGVFGPLEGASSEEVEAQLRTNFFGALSVIRHVMPIMRRQGGGTIINVSSVAGRMAAPFMSLYHASKYALEGFSESFRFEASIHGIRVKLIEPGHFKTGFIGRSLRLTDHPAYARQLANYMEWVQEEDRRAPDAAPVAEAILSAAEDTSGRLRYPVKGRLVLTLARWIPDALWRSLLGQGMTRPLKRRAKAST